MGEDIFSAYSVLAMKLTSVLPMKKQKEPKFQIFSLYFTCNKIM